MLSRQQIFWRVKRHLLTQGAKSVGTRASIAGNICAYHGLDGRRCAIGVLIPEGRYHEHMEGSRVATLAECKCSGTRLLHDALSQGGVTERDFPFLRDLQIIHDHTQVYSWPEYLRTLAERRHLLYDEPIETTSAIATPLQSVAAVTLTERTEAVPCG